MKPLILKFCSPCCFFLHRRRCYPQHLFLEHSQSSLYPYARRRV